MPAEPPFEDRCGAHTQGCRARFVPRTRANCPRRAARGRRRAPRTRRSSRSACVPGAVSGTGLSGPSPDAWERRCLTVAPGGPAGSSRSTMPRSMATRTASATSSLVTDAHSATASRSPLVATSSDRPPAADEHSCRRHEARASRRSAQAPTGAQVSRKRLTANAEPAAPITIPTTTMNTTMTVSSPVGTSRLVWWLGLLVYA